MHLRALEFTVSFQAPLRSNHTESVTIYFDNTFSLIQAAFRFPELKVEHVAALCTGLRRKAGCLTVVTGCFVS